MDPSLEEKILNLYKIENEDLKQIQIQKILENLDVYKLDAFEYYYLKGYLWYQLNDSEPKRDHEIETNLLKSIEENNSYPYSKTYLCYFYFDKKKFSKILTILRDFNFSIYEKKGQLWLSLKMQELYLASKIYTADIFDLELNNEILSLASAYMSIPNEELAIPKELVNSVIDNYKKDGAKEAFSILYTLISSANQRDYFDSNIKNKILKLISETNR